MFVQVIPIDVETQPVLTVAAASAVLLATNGRYGPVSSDLLGVYALIALLGIYCVIGVAQDESTLLEFAKYIIGPLTYLAYRRRTHLVSKEYVVCAVATLGVTGVVLVLAPGLAEAVYARVLPRGVASLASEGSRGLPILVPEPSYFAFFAVLVSAYVEALWIRGEVTRRVRWAATAITVVLCALTRSALVLMYVGCLYAPMIAVARTRTKIRMGVVATAAAVMAATVAPDNRVFEVARAFANVDYDTTPNILLVLCFADPSGGTRILMNIIGFAGMFIRPLGYGLGGFSSAWVSIAEQLELPIESHEVASGVIGAGDVRAQALMPNLATDIGVGSLLLVFIVVAGTKLSRDPAARGLQCGLIVVTVLMFVLQGQITNPIPWVLLALAKDIPASEIASAIKTAAP
jgi:hypothetical protein